jgi:CRP/FNR family transcriptional regulator, cyclic AMP receptor protein
VAESAEGGVKPEELLAGHPFTEGMSPEQLAKVAKCLVGVTRYQTDEVVMRAGVASDRCYLITRGDIAIEAHSPGSGPRIIQTVNGGEVLGWSWMFPPYRTVFDGRALTPTEVLVLDADKLRLCASEDLELGYLVMSRVARMVVDRLQATRLQLLDMYARPS